MRTQEEHNDHMDALALRVGKALEGESIEDGILACAACLAFGLVQLTPEQRDKLRPHVEMFIDGIVRKDTR
jgi:hypothetical protein